MKAALILAAVMALSACGTIDKIVDRRVDFQKCVTALVAGGVSQADAEKVCKRLSENAGGVAALRGAI